MQVMLCLSCARWVEEPARVHKCVCMCVCVCVCACVHKHVRACVSTRERASCGYVCLHVCMRVEHCIPARQDLCSMEVHIPPARV